MFFFSPGSSALHSTPHKSCIDFGKGIIYTSGHKLSREQSTKFNPPHLNKLHLYIIRGRGRALASFSDITVRKINIQQYAVQLGELHTSYDFLSSRFIQHKAQPHFIPTETHPHTLDLSSPGSNPCSPSEFESEGLFFPDFLCFSLVFAIPFPCR